MAARLAAIESASTASVQASHAEVTVDDTDVVIISVGSSLSGGKRKQARHSRQEVPAGGLAMSCSASMRHWLQPMLEYSAEEWKLLGVQHRPAIIVEPCVGTGSGALALKATKG